MKYIKYELKNQLDFTNPYMTIAQMKKMISSNYFHPREYFLYGYSAKEMIENLEEQFHSAFPHGVNEEDLRLPVLVFPIPTGEAWDPVKYGFIVKYEANGTTEIYYPMENKELENNSWDF